MKPTRDNTFELTKAMGGSKICLIVPQRKLGAVLSAIGAALDGLPWNPPRSAKNRTRGRRGGRRNREREVSKVVSESCALESSIPATNSAGKQPVKMVCSKPATPTIHPVLDTEKVSRTTSARKSASKMAASPAPYAGSSSESDHTHTTSTGSVGVPQSLPARKGPQQNENLGLAGLVTLPKLDERTEAINTMRRVLKEARNRIHVPSKPVIPKDVRKPDKNEYGGFFGKPMADYQVALEKYNANSRELTLAMSRSLDRKALQDRWDLHDSEHFKVCNTDCKCDARSSAEYINALSIYHKPASSVVVVERQRRSKGPRV